MAEGRPGQIGHFTWLHLTLVEGLPDVEQQHWETDADDLEVILGEANEVLMRDRWPSAQGALVRHEGCLVNLWLVTSTRQVTVIVSGPDRLATSTVIERIRELLPEHVLDEDAERVGFTAWHHRDEGGAISRTREIEAPSWGDIANNYAASTQRSLELLFEDPRPGEGGQLILWYGPPGTGKTFALRALAWEWRDWTDFHYVTDPDVLFGSRPGYLFEVALDAPEARGSRDKDRWTVLVLEDMGELLAPDARMQMGQGLSRVLNLVDGILGQGLRLLMLVTTNEPVERIHPAVARPGRCAAQVEFQELSPREVEAWFAARGKSVPSDLAGTSATIASLHAAFEGRAAAGTRSVGFVPAPRTDEEPLAG
jgi:hypothetical protein